MYRIFYYGLIIGKMANYPKPEYPLLGKNPYFKALGVTPTNF